MARWMVNGLQYQSAWVHPVTWAESYESAHLIRLKDSDVIHVLLTHDSVPVGGCLAKPPELPEAVAAARAVDAICNFLRSSRARIEFIRLANMYPFGKETDTIEPHVVDGVQAYEAVPFDKPARRGATGLLQPGSFPTASKVTESDDALQRARKADERDIDRVWDDAMVKLDLDAAREDPEAEGELVNLFQLEEEDRAADLKAADEVDPVKQGE